MAILLGKIIAFVAAVVVCGVVVLAPFELLVYAGYGDSVITFIVFSIWLVFLCSVLIVWMKRRDD